MTDPNQPPNPYQQGPGQPYQYAPPKKSNTTKIVLIVIGVLLVLFCGGCLAVGGLFASGVDDAVDELEETLDSEAANDKPSAVQEGAAFERDGYSVAAGWKVVEEEFSGTNITGMSVTVDAADPDLPDTGRTPYFTFSFYKGKTVLLEVTCNANEMQVGESSKMDCFGDGETITGYDTIKVADAF